MSDYSSRSIYINLKGEWTPSAFNKAREAVEIFMNDIGHDGVGEPDLSDEGQAYAYDAGYPSENLLDRLVKALDCGPAWMIRIEEGDEIGITTHVAGPDVAAGTTVHGDLEDPSVRLSQINDTAHISNLRAAQTVGKMPFGISVV